MKSVYIIEPDIVLAKAYAEAISQSGFNCIIFRTARLALKALDKLMPDCVVFELALPAHNGLEFMYELRSYSDTSKVKLIAFTYMKYRPEQWEYVSLEDYGIVKYLEKQSTSIDQLVNAVKEQIYEN